MAIKIGLNGYGRIGRVALRIMAERGFDRYDVCAINLRKVDLDQMVYQTKYDSVFGRFNGEVSHDGENLIINGKKIHVFSEDAPENIKWSECGAEYIIETTGVILKTEDAKAHLANGAKKVIFSAPAKDDTPTFVMGVNNETYSPDMAVVSNASCTTNCLAPMVKVVNDKYGIEEGLMTTVHSMTSKQKTVDSRAKDWRIGRGITDNIIPSTTGAAKAVALVIPEMKGKLTGMSMRIPTSDVSVVDLTIRLKNAATYDGIVEAMREAAEGPFKGIILSTSDPIVSCDVLGQNYSCVFDEKAGIMLNEKFVKLIAWYDNEWGYTSNLIKLVDYMYERDHA